MNPEQRIRADIQGLRGIAVFLVLLFHLFPSLISGGYVGVDVFFVISGYLITGLLVREQIKTESISLLRFYGRRVTRLLPASTTVIVATCAASFFIVPAMDWSNVALHAAASALYAENWLLYYQAVDYLTADFPPSPFQHYWSLAIEEQFYIFWPVLILFLGKWSLKTGIRSDGLFLGVFAGVSIVSLYLSVAPAEQNEAEAYFLTWTRIWELSLGAMAALVPSRLLKNSAWSEAIILGCLSTIIASALLFSEQTPFPGYHALFPTVATALILILGEKSGRRSWGYLLRNRPIRFVGDISYSLYLWHWPFVILAPIFLGQSLGAVSSFAVLLMSVCFAALSKLCIEDAFRATASSEARYKPFRVFLACMAISLFAAGALHYLAASLAEEARKVSVVGGDYPGAASLFAGLDAPATAKPSYIPDLLVARDSLPAVYERRCHVARDEIEPRPCEFRPANESVESTRLLMIVGDSHAAQWLPAFRLIAESYGWTVISHTKSSCPYIAAELIVAQRPYPECLTWVHRVREDVLARKPDLVVTAMITNHFAVNTDGVADNQERLANGLLAAWQPLLDAGIPMLAIKGTPRMEEDIPACLAREAPRVDVCGLPRSVAMDHGGAMQQASERAGENVNLVNFTDAFCSAEYCSPIVGNVVVYRDQNHITKAYMSSLAPLLEIELNKRGLLN